MTDRFLRTNGAKPQPRGCEHNENWRWMDAPAPLPPPVTHSLMSVSLHACAGGVCRRRVQKNRDWLCVCCCTGAVTCSCVLISSRVCSPEVSPPHLQPSDAIRTRSAENLTEASFSCSTSWSAASLDTQSTHTYNLPLTFALSPRCHSTPPPSSPPPPANPPRPRPWWHKCFRRCIRRQQSVPQRQDGQDCFFSAAPRTCRRVRRPYCYL